MLCAGRLELPLADSHVSVKRVSRLALLVNNLTILFVVRLSNMYSVLCRLTTARFDVRSRHENPTTAVHSSAPVPACYVTRRHSRGSVIALGPVEKL
jgi:hypothetical protein